MVVTVAVTATFLCRSGATLVFALTRTTASDKILNRRPSFQDTILLKRQRQRQRRVCLWNNPYHDGNNRSRKELFILSESDGDGTMMVLIGPEASRERLELENARLKERLKEIEQENLMLHYEVSSRIVLETFEGEGKMRRLAQQKHEQQKFNFYDGSIIDYINSSLPLLTWTGQDNMPVLKSPNAEDDIAGMWCDELAEDGACPVEPLVSFQEALRDRAYWLVGLLVLQSGSGIILAHNQDLLANHSASKLLGSLLINRSFGKEYRFELNSVHFFFLR